MFRVQICVLLSNKNISQLSVDTLEKTCDKKVCCDTLFEEHIALTSSSSLDYCLSFIMFIRSMQNKLSIEKYVG
jgi:hypothetical protein